MAMTQETQLIKKAIGDDVLERTLNKTRPSSTFRDLCSTDKSTISKLSSRCSAGKSSKDVLRQKMFTHRDEQL
jgi:hypothetical protein